jgi:hypothetical protein
MDGRRKGDGVIWTLAAAAVVSFAAGWALPSQPMFDLYVHDTFIAISTAAIGVLLACTFAIVAAVLFATKGVGR